MGFFARIVRWFRSLFRRRRRRSSVVRAESGSHAEENFVPAVELPLGDLLTNYNAANVHSRDFNCLYDNETDTYYFGRQSLRRLSGFIDSFFTPFDELRHAADAARARGEDVAKVIEEWHAANEEAKEAGRVLHSNLERILLRQLQSVPFSFRYSGAYVRVSRPYSLVPEINQLLEFSRAYKIRPYRTLWNVYDEKAALVTRLDLLATDEDGRFMLVDIVRSNKIGHEVDGGFALDSGRIHGYGLGFLSHVPDSEYYRISLRLSVASRILSEHYSINVAQTSILFVHSSFKTFHLVPSAPLNDVVSGVLYDAYVTR